MSIRVMSAVWDNGPADSTQRFVLLAIADHTSDDGGNAYPSVQTIAKKCAMSTRTVIRAIDALIGDGYLIRRRRKDTTNMYKVVLARLQPDEKSVSDKLSLTVGDIVSPTEVTQCHLVGDTVSPDPSINHPINRPKEERRARPLTVQSQVFDRTPNGNGYHPPAEPEPAPAVIDSAPPAARLINQLTGYWPGTANEAFLVRELGDAPNETALARAVELWRASGHRPNNYAGICEWYHELERDMAWTPSARFKNGHGKPASQPAPRVVMKEIAPGLY